MGRGTVSSFPSQLTAKRIGEKRGIGAGKQCTGSANEGKTSQKAEIHRIHNPSPLPDQFHPFGSQLEHLRSLRHQDHQHHLPHSFTQKDTATTLHHLSLANHCHPNLHHPQCRRHGYTIHGPQGQKDLGQFIPLDIIENKNNVRGQSAPFPLHINVIK